MLALIGCGSAKKTFVSNATLDKMIVEETFKIEVKSAEPQITTALAQVGSSGVIRPGSTMSHIDVTGEGYFVKLDGKNVATSLPYFGERQMGGGYGSDAGININGTVRDLKITKDGEKHGYEVTFSIDNSSESYFFTIDLGTSLTSTIRVRSSHRNRIRYAGVVKEFDN